MTLRARIHAAQRRLGLHQAEVARQIGVTDRTLRGLGRRRHSKATLDAVRKWLALHPSPRTERRRTAALERRVAELEALVTAMGRKP